MIGGGSAEVINAAGEAFSDVGVGTFKVVGTAGKVVSSAADATASAANTGKILVDVNPIYYRPREVHELKADISKAKELINWNPSVDLDALVKKMVNYDLTFDEYGEDRG